MWSRGDLDAGTISTTVVGRSSAGAAANAGDAVRRVHRLLMVWRRVALDLEIAEADGIPAGSMPRRRGTCRRTGTEPGGTSPGGAAREDLRTVRLADDDPRGIKASEIPQVG